MPKIGQKLKSLENPFQIVWTETSEISKGYIGLDIREGEFRFGQLILIHGAEAKRFIAKLKEAGIKVVKEE